MNLDSAPEFIEFHDARLAMCTASDSALVLSFDHSFEGVTKLEAKGRSSFR